jgi:hypothetical protein
MQYREGWSIRNNNKLQQLTTGDDILRYIKSQRIKQGDILKE